MTMSTTVHISYDNDWIDEDLDVVEFDGGTMTEQEYQDKLKVRSLLSISDKILLLVHEHELLKEEIQQCQETIARIQEQIKPLPTIGPDKLET
jgi:hypothetical protein